MEENGKKTPAKLLDAKMSPPAQEAPEPWRKGGKAGPILLSAFLFLRLSLALAISKLMAF